MCIPLEFVVNGLPSSVNGKDPKRKQEWQSDVLSSCQTAIARKQPISIPAPYADDVTVKVFYFPKTDQYSDVDNGLKHLIDAFSEQNGKISNPPKLLMNDKQVMRIIAERIKRTAGALVNVPVGSAAGIAEAISGTKQATAIRVEAYASNGGDLW